MTYDPASAWDEADSAPFAAPHVQRGDLVSVQLTDGTLITDTYFVIDKTEQSARQTGIAAALDISPEEAKVIDLREWVREPAEPWHGKAGQS